MPKEFMTYFIAHKSANVSNNLNSTAFYRQNEFNYNLTSR
jgi:hypothetical protein